MTIFRSTIRPALILLTAALLLAIAMQATSSEALAKPVIVVTPGSSIQDAVDSANPGDTIRVRPGTYTGTVTVTTPDITIVGPTTAVIDASGFAYGIMVGDDAPIGSAGCPPITVEGFELRGLTIQNADDTGVRLVGVDGYKLSHSRYIDNENHGASPVCSMNGEISHNFASGHNDAAINVSNDVNTVVRKNVAVDNVVGVQIENSLNTVVTHNRIEDNAAGLLVFVGPGLPMPFTETVYVGQNKIRNNNGPNIGSGSVASVPEGTGILVYGSDDVTIEDNQISGNDSFGMMITGNFNTFLDPRIEPFNDDVIVQENSITGNGANPDPLRTFTPGADIIFLPDVFDPGPITGVPGTLLIVDPDPSDNCFSDNEFDVEFPPGIVAAFTCP